MPEQESLVGIWISMFKNIAIEALKLPTLMNHVVYDTPPNVPMFGISTKAGHLRELV